MAQESKDFSAGAERGAAMALTCTAARAGRLSSFLKSELGLSTGLMNRLKWEGRLFVNGMSVHTDYPVCPGDVISVPLDEPAPAYPPEDGPLTVLYEDEFLLAVDKPAGMLIHPSRAQNTGTLANRVAFYYQATSQPCAFHPSTRLDRDTYGVVLLAKNSHVHHILNRLHSEGKLEKTYHALVYGGPEKACGQIDAPIARVNPPSLLREIRPDGKPARSEYTLLTRLDGCSKLSLRPLTGRTHQLRLHCLYMGWPILGDPQYHTAESLAFSQSLGLTAQCLCAISVALPHPISGQRLEIHSKMGSCLPSPNV